MTINKASSSGVIIFSYPRKTTINAKIMKRIISHIIFDLEKLIILKQKKMSEKWSNIDRKEGATQNGRNMVDVINKMVTTMPEKEKEEFLIWCHDWYQREVIFVAPEIMGSMWRELYYKLIEFVPKEEAWGQDVWDIFSAKK